MIKFRKIFNAVATIVLIVSTVLVAIVFIQRLTNITPSAFGYRFYNVATDSMTPVLNVDDVILVHECDAETVKKGDIVTYRGLVGSFKGKDVTHKVVKEPVKNNDGSYTFQTRGVKEGAALDPKITGDQIIGKYVTKLSVLSMIYKVFKQWYGLLIFLIFVFVLMGSEVYNLRKISAEAELQAELAKELSKQKMAEEDSEENSEEKSEENSEEDSNENK